jgi:mRNA-degrading endonuclease RelE of RelBE toxin-antitoxin system
MKIDWDFTAQTFLDQLPAHEQARVTHAVTQLGANWDGLEGKQLSQVNGALSELFSLRVGGDLRVLLRRRGDTIVVVDVVRRSQIEGLRHLRREPQAAPG